MAAPWRNKNPFVWIERIFREATQGFSLDDEVSNTMNAALHEIDDLNAEIYQLEMVIKELVKWKLTESQENSLQTK